MKEGETYMDGNLHMLEGKWHEFKGQARQTFAKLIDGERQSGKLEEFSGVLQQVYGFTKAQVDKTIGPWLKRRR